jgi:hypothetical protein
MRARWPGLIFFLPTTRIYYYRGFEFLYLDDWTIDNDTSVVFYIGSLWEPFAILSFRTMFGGQGNNVICECGTRENV